MTKNWGIAITYLKIWRFHSFCIREKGLLSSLTIFIFQRVAVWLYRTIAHSLLELSTSSSLDRVVARVELLLAATITILLVVAARLNLYV